MHDVALELLEGMAPFVERELARVVPAAEVTSVEDTEVRALVPDIAPLLGLATVVAAHVVVTADVRRPRGLRSPDQLRRVAEAVAAAQRVAAPARFTGLRISAAGAGSDDFMALRADLATATGVPLDDEDGDLLLRFRRGGGGGWEVLVRMTPRPLSARAWRVAHHPAGLNATVAAAVVEVTDPQPDQRVVDLTCGSGTILIERLARGAAAELVGIDVDDAALDAARENQRAARRRGRIDWLHRDLRTVVELGRQFDVVVSNPPWGERSGEHADNDVLYPDLLSAAHDVAEPDAVLAVLTHDIRRFERAVAADPRWVVTGTWRIFQKGHRPALFRLRPSGSTGP